jgi:hypothetical protein
MHSVYTCFYIVNYEKSKLIEEELMHVFLIISKCRMSLLQQMGHHAYKQQLLCQ